MKNIKIHWFKACVSLMASLFVLCGIFAVAPAIAMAASLGVGIGSGFVELPKDVAFVTLQGVYWNQNVEGYIFKQNPFMDKAVDVSAQVTDVNGYKFVIIPQAGAPTNVVKNRKRLPAIITERQDKAAIYTLDILTGDPRLISIDNSRELDYNYQDSVMGDDKMAIMQAAAESTLLNWVSAPTDYNQGPTRLPTSRVIFSTGDNGTGTPVTVNNATILAGSTGNRLSVTRQDFQNMYTAFVAENRWFDGQMYALITPQMLQQLFPANDQLAQIALIAAKMGGNNAINVGYLDGLFGWQVLVRSSVYVSDSSGNIILDGSAPGASSCQGALFWYKGAVEIAKGGLSLFSEPNKPEYYGDVFSFAYRIGGRARRVNYEGLRVLVQGTPS